MIEKNWLNLPYKNQKNEIFKQLILMNIENIFFDKPRFT